MVNRIFQLMDTQRIEMVHRQVPMAGGGLIVRPKHLAICAADQRYYFGLRPREIMMKKLPMALIHEATGTVMHDFEGILPTGASVVLVPLVEGPDHRDVKGNYRPSSSFLSSDGDGFLQDFIAVPHSRVIPIPGTYDLIYVFSELLSVALNALHNAKLPKPGDARARWGVWGDGSMGYMMTLALKCLYPEAPLYVFGKKARKLQKFSFASKVIYIDDVPEDIKVDHCVECVGGNGSESALQQIMNVISPQGTISILGVSEEPIGINTRLVLEKGLSLFGNSRSDADDIRQAVCLIRDNDLCRHYLQMLISEVINIHTDQDITAAFEQSNLNDFKTLMNWSI